MINDAIRLIAAALCGDSETEHIGITPQPELGAALALLCCFGANGQMGPDGTVALTPPTRAPRGCSLRFAELPRDLFFLFAGVAVKTNGLLQVDSVTGGVTAAELQALSDAMGGVFVYTQTNGGVLTSAYTQGDVFDPRFDFPPAFAAGVLLGAAMAERRTVFRLGGYAETPEVLQAIEALEAYGAAQRTANGVTVKSFLSRFSPKTGKRRKTKKRL